MRKAILVLLLAIINNSAKAEWMNIYSDYNFSIFADLSTISKNGNLVKMWFLYDFKVEEALTTSTPTESETWQKEFDCQGKKIRSIHMTLFTQNMGKGSAIRTDDEIGNWAPFQADSLNEIEWEIACGKK